MTTNSNPGTKSLRKGRYSRAHGVYLITIVTDGRVPWFSRFDLACVMCRCIGKAGHVSDARLLCWVLMPDHAHLLLELNSDGLDSVVRSLKSGSALRLNRLIGRKGRLWQPGFHDRGLRREDDIKDVARYIIANPLRAKLTRKYGDYPFWDAIWV